ncbi:MAG: spore germination protein [Peptostreptococcales bacterium]
MFDKLFRKLNYLKLGSSPTSSENITTQQEISESIDAVKNQLNATFFDCSDFAIREIEAGKVKMILAFMDGIVKQDSINANILKPLLTELKLTGLDEKMDSKNAFEILTKNLLSESRIRTNYDFSQSIDAILTGDTVLFIDGNNKALQFDTKGFESRGVTEPQTEAVVRGPREGFTETLRVNTALLRRKIKTPDLKLERIIVGRQTQTEICIAYIKGIANDDVISTVKARLEKIDTDAILESGYIEEFIEDSPLSLFPTIGNSEKPDIVAAKLLEGRVAIICDGTPFVLTVPYLFIESIQASEDYYSRSFYSSFIRWIRVLALFITTLVPALYVAIICFHQDMIPSELFITISASREGIPFSPLVESLLMVITFELLREAGVRMPKAVGDAVSIVGALVLGQASVEAGLVSNLMVIVIAITAITGFVITPMAGIVPIIRICLLLSANILGLMGIALTFVAIYVHACSLWSFGVPYMAPVSPLYGMDLKDAFIRVPVWAMLKRPKALTERNKDSSTFRMKVDFKKRIKNE